MTQFTVLTVLASAYLIPKPVTVRWPEPSSPAHHPYNLFLSDPATCNPLIFLNGQLPIRFTTTHIPATRSVHSKQPATFHWCNIFTYPAQITTFPHYTGLNYAYSPRSGIMDLVWFSEYTAIVFLTRINQMISEENTVVFSWGRSRIFIYHLGELWASNA